MNGLVSKTLALGGLVALCAGASSAALAQGYGYGGPWHHGPHRVIRHERRHIMALKAAYGHDVATGHYRAAAAAHERAMAIRHHIRHQRHDDWQHRGY